MYVCRQLSLPVYFFFRIKMHTNKLADNFPDEEKVPDREKKNQMLSFDIKEIAPIFKLNLDCCDEIFILLPLNDLHSLSETCRAMQRAVGIYFQRNYKAIKIDIKCGAIRLDRLQLNGFSQFIENICIDDGMENFQFAGAHCNATIRKIYFDVACLTNAKIDCIKGILSKVEIIMLSECIVDDDLHEGFLKFCPNLKRLSVVSYDEFQNQWLSHSYPRLEYLKLAGQVTLQFDDIKRFFENNPKCSNFWIDARFLLEHRHSFMEAALRWSDITTSMAPNYAEDMTQFLILLKEFHKVGVYQRLHLFLNGHGWNRSFLDQLASVPALVNLCLEYFENFDVEGLNDLKKLEVYMPMNVTFAEVEIVATSLVNLERIVFRETSSNEILPFIRHSKKLKEIRLCLLKEGIHFNNGYLNLHKLNEEREKLNGARKVTIYVDEKVFLATKWKTVKSEWAFVEIRRISGYQDPSFYATYV